MSKELRELNRKNIMKMVEDTHYCICPNCRQHVFPRFVKYPYWVGYPYKSGLYWCPKCLKGKAGIFWRKI